MVFSDAFRMGGVADWAGQTVPDKARQPIKALPMAAVVRTDGNLLFDALRSMENCFCGEFIVS